MSKKEYVVIFAECRIWAESKEDAFDKASSLISEGGHIKFDVMEA